MSLLVMPETNATNESGKTHLRATTSDARLNHFITLHFHRARTDKINLVNAANESVGQYESRKQCLGDL